MSDSTETIQNIRAMDEALHVLFTKNFDADSKSCVLTLFKILDNIIHQPSNDKVRQIRLENFAFHNKVGSRHGGIQFLEACGFVRRTEPLPLLSLVGSNSPQEQQGQLVWESDDVLILHTAQRLLRTRAIQDLGVSPDEFPNVRPPPVQDVASFNPYQGHHFDAQSAAVGAQLGPDANYVSPTEAQLQKLKTKQKQLEASLSLPDREWRAFAKGEVIITTSANQLTTNNDNLATAADSNLLAQHLKQQQVARQQKETLTTKAMRDLERLKKTKVYSHAALTIQFPDGCKLQGKFLPNETIETVRKTIQEDCLDSSSRQFDLYMTPPRRLLPPKSTLQQEGLVPAAKIFVSWKNSSTPTTTSYLQAHLFQNDNAPVEFPSAKPVVVAQEVKTAPEPSAKKPVSQKEDREEELLRRMLGGATARSTNSSSETNKKEIKKPKWFKSS